MIKPVALKNSVSEVKRHGHRMRRFSLFVLILFAFLILVSAAQSDDRITAKVVKVADGDSITVLAPGNKQVKIRLHGIDCSEREQAFGKKAKQFTSSQCFGKITQYRKVAMIYTKFWIAPLNGVMCQE